MCPGVLTIAGTIDGSVVLVRFVVIDRRIDIDLAIQGATAVVVTAIDSCAVSSDEGVATVPVDVRLIDIARIFIIQTVCTTKDFLAAEGRACRYVNNRTTGDPLLIATAIDRLKVTAQEIDDG